MSFDSRVYELAGDKSLSKALYENSTDEKKNSGIKGLRKNGKWVQNNSVIPPDGWMT